MEDASRVGEARRHAAELSRAAGLDEVDAGRVAIVVTELGNNLVRHAHHGSLLIGTLPGSCEVEVISMDKGPGIADVGRSMGDGFSTGGTPGTGLGAVKRLSQDFDIHSAVPDGTVILARLRGKAAANDSAIARGIRLCAPGEFACGDGWVGASDGERVALLVADGLGHGPSAAEASQAAVETFEQDPLASPAITLQRVHERLRSTRGAAVAIVAMDPGAGKVHASGAGNVVARLVSGASDRTLLMQHGTAGLQIRRPEVIAHDWPSHALLIVHSDGIETRWNVQRLLPVLARDLSLVAAMLVRDHCRGRDDATVVVARRRD